MYCAQDVYVQMEFHVNIVLPSLSNRYRCKSLTFLLHGHEQKSTAVQNIRLMLLDKQCAGSRIVLPQDDSLRISSLTSGKYR